MDNYTYTPLYYPVFQRVRFWNPNIKQWEDGVGFHNFIWNGSKEVFNIEEIIELARLRGIHFDDAIVEYAW